MKYNKLAIIFMIISSVGCNNKIASLENNSKLKTASVSGYTSGNEEMTYESVDSEGNQAFTDLYGMEFRIEMLDNKSNDFIAEGTITKGGFYIVKEMTNNNLSEMSIASGIGTVYSIKYNDDGGYIFSIDFKVDNKGMQNIRISENDKEVIECELPDGSIVTYKDLVDNEM